MKRGRLIGEKVPSVKMESDGKEEVPSEQAQLDKQNLYFAYVKGEFDSWEEEFGSEKLAQLFGRSFRKAKRQLALATEKCKEARGLDLYYTADPRYAMNAEANKHVLKAYQLMRKMKERMRKMQARQKRSAEEAVESTSENNRVIDAEELALLRLGLLSDPDKMPQDLR